MYMTTQLELQREGLPVEMQVLLADYPREAWPDNPHFARSIQNWMSAHQMFRQLAAIVRGDTEEYLDNGKDPDDLSRELSRYGDLLVRNLHGHHTWEDREYFPELRTADRRFDKGLALLEEDHRILDGTLNRFTTAANRVIKLVQLDEAKAREEAVGLHDCSEQIEGLLERHLADEEDLIVPILLHHKLRG